MPDKKKLAVAVVGGGPAGLMAAEVLSDAGVHVDLFDAMPSVGRKFLLAGIGGLNLTHSEGLPQFLARYGEREPEVAGWLADFSPDNLRAWAGQLGIATFIGSSGRIFPSDMKAAPLLRAWLHRLRSRGVRLHMRHRWVGWGDEAAAAASRPPVLRFATPSGEQLIEADSVVLALGGASWPKLGSDGAWLPLLQARGVEIAPLQPANCGFDIGLAAAVVSAHVCVDASASASASADGVAVTPGWSELFRSRAAGQVLKTVAISIAAADGTETLQQRGEFVFTETGIEGSLVYALSAALRQRITCEGQVMLHLDLLPDRSAEWVHTEVTKPRGSRSMSSHLKSRLRIDSLKTLLLHELLPPETFNDTPALAKAIKALPLQLIAPRPLAEAISTAGGVCLHAFDDGLMLQQMPGVFCAGEMLDWEAPTGGYLLTAALASGRRAGQGAVRWLGRNGNGAAGL